jgi:hypothetical protein
MTGTGTDQRKNSAPKLATTMARTSTAYLGRKRGGKACSSQRVGELEEGAGGLPEVHQGTACKEGTDVNMRESLGTREDKR